MITLLQGLAALALLLVCALLAEAAAWGALRLRTLFHEDQVLGRRFGASADPEALAAVEMERHQSAVLEKATDRWLEDPQVRRLGLNREEARREVARMIATATGR